MTNGDEPTRGSDIPDGFLMVDFVPSRYDQSYAELMVRPHVHDSGGKFFFRLYGPIGIIEDSYNNLESLSRLGHPAAKDFIAYLYDLAQHEPTDQVLRGWSAEVSRVIGLDH